MRPHMQKRPLLVEHLEDRCVPAGNVLAVMEGTTLVITGDEHHNAVAVVGYLDDTVAAWGLETSINGSVQTQFFSGVRRIEFLGGDGDDSFGFMGVLNGDMLIDTANGDDQVSVMGGLLAGNLQISTADGKDRIRIDAANQFGSVAVDTGNGGDVVALTLGLIDGNLSIDTGNGDDVIFVGTSMAGPYSYGYLSGDLNIDGGNGQHDRLYLDRSFNQYAGALNISGIEIQE